MIVDEDSYFCMTETNMKAIRQTLDKYNQLFSYINPEITFKYISKKDYEKGLKNDNPFIYITTQLKIETPNGPAIASTSPPKVGDSKFQNGKVSTYATIVFSSVEMVDLSLEEQTSIVSHEFAHALCVVGHSNDQASLMHTYGRGDAVASDEFSKDVMMSLYALYYNPNTNPRTNQEILDYINLVSTVRLNEMSEND